MITHRLLHDFWWTVTFDIVGRWCRPRKVARSCEQVCEWPAKRCESADKKVWTHRLFCEWPPKKCEWARTFPWLSTRARRQKCERARDWNSASQEMFSDQQEYRHLSQWKLKYLQLWCHLTYQNYFRQRQGYVTFTIRWKTKVIK